MKLCIGAWIESGRLVVKGTRYAADGIEVQLKAGEYPLYLTFEIGYLIPMPYWLMASVAGDVIGGGYFSGCAGMNFAFEPAKLEPTTYTVQTYEYQIVDMLAAGRARLSPDFEARLREHGSFREWAMAENITWQALAAMAKG